MVDREIERRAALGDSVAANAADAAGAASESSNSIRSAADDGCVTGVGCGDRLGPSQRRAHEYLVAQGTAFDVQPQRGLYRKLSRHDDAKAFHRQLRQRALILSHLNLQTSNSTAPGC